MTDKTVAIVTDPDDLGTAIATGKADGTKLSYTHSATTDDLYVVGVDISKTAIDAGGPALIPDADDNIGNGTAVTQQPAVVTLSDRLAWVRLMRLVRILLTLFVLFSHLFRLKG